MTEKAFRELVAAAADQIEEDSKNLGPDFIRALCDELHRRRVARHVSKKRAKP
jgi:hypothetical protein